MLLKTEIYYIYLEKVEQGNEKIIKMGVQCVCVWLINYCMKKRDILLRMLWMQRQVPGSCSFQYFWLCKKIYKNENKDKQKRKRVGENEERERERDVYFMCGVANSK